MHDDINRNSDNFMISAILEILNGPLYTMDFENEVAMHVTMATEKKRTLEMKRFHT